MTGFIGQLRAPGLIRTGVIAVSAALFALVSATHGLGNARGTKVAPIAATVAPWHSASWARLSELGMAFATTPTARRTAIAQAEYALRRDPTNIRAIRSMGELYRLVGDDARGARLARLSQALGWRDLITQRFAARAAIEANDGPRALRHYSAAMLTNRSGWEQMMPALVAATADPALAPQLARVLARRPQWIDLFNSQWVPSAPRPETMPLLTREMERLGSPVSDETRSGVLGRLITAQLWALVRDEYARGRAGRGAGARAILADGFAHAGKLRPLDWQINDAGNAAVSLAGGRLLTSELEGPAQEEIARRLLLLPPGRHRFTARVTHDEASERPAAGGEGIELQLVCAEGAGALLGSVTRGNGAIILDADVPATCRAQWLFIRHRVSGAGIIVSAVSPVLLASESRRR